MSHPYEVTATRRRPNNFNSMLGQEFVASAISNSINNNRIAHAYLFAGPRGVGKTSSARILARSLNCVTGPTSTPCGVCVNCIDIARGSSLDVIEIDGASNTGVGDVREIKDEVLFPPTSSKYKIYIIDEVHMLSINAFNALLKTIEEPPSYIIFIFATTETHKVPATIKSRCQQFNFRLIDIDTVKNALAEAAIEMSVKADDEALFWIAKEGGGSMRDAYTLFDQAIAFADGHLTLNKIREKMGLANIEELNQLLTWCATENRRQALLLTKSLADKGISAEQLLIDLAEYFRNLLYIKSGINKESILGLSPERFAAEPLETFTISQCEHALEAIFKLYRDIRFSINIQFEIELLISRFCALKTFLTHQEIAEQLRVLKENFIISIEEENSVIAPNLPAVVAEPDYISTTLPAPQVGLPKVTEPDLTHNDADTFSLLDGSKESVKKLKEALIKELAADSMIINTLHQSSWVTTDKEITIICDKMLQKKQVEGSKLKIVDLLYKLTQQNITIVCQLNTPPKDEYATAINKIKEMFFGEVIG